jgi:hypothetical protein
MNIAQTILLYAITYALCEVVFLPVMQWREWEERERRG